MIAAFVVPETYVSVENQLLLFGGACLLGIPCGLVFDLLRLLRRLIPHHAAVTAIEDIAFPVICGFLLLGYTSAFALGEFRMYYVIGCLVGFVLYECTLGRPLLFVGSRICALLRRPVLWAGRSIATICLKVSHSFVETSKKTKKAQKNAQNLLQDAPSMVYNKRRNIKKVGHYGKSQKTRK